MDVADAPTHGNHGMIETLCHNDGHGIAGEMTCKPVINERVDNVAALDATTTTLTVNAESTDGKCPGHPSPAFNSFTISLAIR